MDGKFFEERTILTFISLYPVLVFSRFFADGQKSTPNKLRDPCSDVQIRTHCRRNKGTRQRDPDPELCDSHFCERNGLGSGGLSKGRSMIVLLIEVNNKMGTGRFTFEGWIIIQRL